MAKSGHHRELTWLRHLLVSAVVIGIGASLIRLSAHIKELGWPSWEPVVSNIGGLLIASVGIALVWEVVSKRSFANEVMAIARLSEDVRAAGLRNIAIDFYTGIDWPELLKNPKEIEVMVAYAGTWLSTHLNQLKKLAVHGTVRVKFILPDPEEAWVIDELARRFNQTPEILRNKIRNTEDLLRDLFEKESPAKNRLELWYIKKPMLYTYYKLDDVYVLTTYRMNDRGVVPALIFDKNGQLAEFLDSDARALINEDKKVARRIVPPPKQD